MKDKIELLREHGFKWVSYNDSGSLVETGATAVYLQGPDGKLWKTHQIDEIVAEIESGILQQRLDDPGNVQSDE